MITKILILFFLFFSFSYAYADEPILITKSGGLEKIIFDGKWTDELEWKPTSYDSIVFPDDNKLILRSAHQGDFIYIQVNFPTDYVTDNDSDSATICFDSKNDKTLKPQEDDFCFFTTLNGKNSFTYQGNNASSSDSFKKIPNHEDFIAIGSISDKHDRYSKTPHPSYEFKIPLELLGRSDNYGFYFSVFEANSFQTYSWPTKIETNNSMINASPNEWGEMISPDKSLPELNLPLLIFAILICTVIVIQSKVKVTLFRT